MTVRERFSAIEKIAAKGEWKPQTRSLDDLARDREGAAAGWGNYKAKLEGDQKRLGEEASKNEGLGTAAYVGAAVPATAGAVTAAQQLFKKLPPAEPGGRPVKIPFKASRVGSRLGGGIIGAAAMYGLGRWLKSKAKDSRTAAAALNPEIERAEQERQTDINTANRLKSGYLPGGKFIWRR